MAPLANQALKSAPLQSMSNCLVPPLLLIAVALAGSAASKSALGVPAANVSEMSSIPVKVAPAAVYSPEVMESAPDEASTEAAEAVDSVAPAMPVQVTLTPEPSMSSANARPAWTSCASEARAT